MGRVDEDLQQDVIVENEIESAGLGRRSFFAAVLAETQRVYSGRVAQRSGNGAPLRSSLGN